jgi:hypothetical protein
VLCEADVWLAPHPVSHAHRATLRMATRGRIGASVCRCAASRQGLIGREVIGAGGGEATAVARQARGCGSEPPTAGRLRIGDLVTCASREAGTTGGADRGWLSALSTSPWCSAPSVG